MPPIFAVGIYFCLWHAPRHVARLMLLDEDSSKKLGRGRLLPAVASFARDLLSVSDNLARALDALPPETREGMGDAEFGVAVNV